MCPRAFGGQSGHDCSRALLQYFRRAAGSPSVPRFVGDSARPGRRQAVQQRSGSKVGSHLGFFRRRKASDVGCCLPTWFVAIYYRAMGVKKTNPWDDSVYQDLGHFGTQNGYQIRCQRPAFGTQKGSLFWFSFWEPTMGPY